MIHTFVTQSVMAQDALIEKWDKILPRIRRIRTLKHNDKRVNPTDSWTNMAIFFYERILRYHALRDKRANPTDSESFFKNLNIEYIAT